MDRSEKKILVVGAGAAGLAASVRLLEAGFEVAVLEAGGYVGGRVVHLDIGGGDHIELGASLIHSEDLELYALAKENGWLDVKHGAARFVVNGRLMGPIRTVLAMKPSEWLRAGRVFKRFYAYEGEDMPLGRFIKSITGGGLLYRLMSTLYSSSLGTPLDSAGIMSLRYSLAREDLRFEKEDLVSRPVTPPFIELLRPYIDQLEGRIHLNQRVNSIRHHGEVRCKTDQGKEYRGRAAVITVPLPVLQDGDIDFQPPLPPDKLKAFSRLGMGQGLKAALVFKQDIIGRRCSYLVDSDCSMVFFVHRLKGGGQALIAYITDGRYLSSSDDEVTEELTDYLDELFDGRASPALVQAHVLNWSQQKDIRGLYSHDKVNSKGARDDLAKPVGGTLFFAGEASIYGHASTVDGALLSGRRAADEVTAAIG